MSTCVGFLPTCVRFISTCVRHPLTCVGLISTYVWIFFKETSKLIEMLEMLNLGIDNHSKTDNLFFEGLILQLVLPCVDLCLPAFDFCQHPLTCVSLISTCGWIFFSKADFKVDRDAYTSIGATMCWSMSTCVGFLPTCVRFISTCVRHPLTCVGLISNLRMNILQ